MAEALTKKRAYVSGIDPATEAIAAARSHAAQSGLDISYDVGVGEDLPYADVSFDAVVCVDVLEHVEGLTQVMAEIARVLKPDGTLLYDTINRNPLARLAAITFAEDILRLLPQGTHDPELFIRPAELTDIMEKVGLCVGPSTGLGPRGINRRGDLIFGPFPSRAIIHMGLAQKPGASGVV